MPRQLKVVVSCDYCKTPIEHEDHEGSLVLSINGKGPRQLDLCDDCLENLGPRTVIALFDTSDDLPQPKPAKRGSKATSVNPCPACTYVGVTPQALGRHCNTEHGRTVAELREETLTDG